jgi:hypothetical protein
VSNTDNTSTSTTSQRGNGSKIAALSAIILLGLVVTAAHYYWPFGSHSNFKPEQALGVVAAQETEKVLGGGGRVLVIAGESADPLVTAQIAAFESVVRKDPTISSVAVERLLPMNPLLRTRNPGGPPYDTAEFARALEKHPHVDALVSFAGLPVDNSSQLATLKQQGCKVIAVFASSAPPELPGAMASHSIDLAIVLRDAPLANISSPRSLRDYFDKYYVVLKAD